MSDTWGERVGRPVREAWERLPELAARVVSSSWRWSADSPAGDGPVRFEDDRVSVVIQALIMARDSAYTDEPYRLRRKTYGGADPSHPIDPYDDPYGTATVAQLIVAALDLAAEASDG